ncbi:MAG: hypothetical protein FD180_3181 [Planctomycetota bacterium]|nr:MAG: hypothetical protein FD180_3181 [Planctomycetota bacterium]
MTASAKSAERLTRLISLLRPVRSPRLPESLTAAAAAGDVEAMRLFLDRGANLEEKSAGFPSPLGAACSAGRVEAVRWLIARGAALDPPGAQISPIDSALGKVHGAVTALLLEAGLPVPRAAGGIPMAAALGRIDLIRWLVGRGLDLDSTHPPYGVLRTRAVANAEKNGHPELAGLLRSGGDLGAPPAAPPEPLRRIPEEPRASEADRASLVEEAVSLVRAGGKAAARWQAEGVPGVKRELSISHAAATGATEIVKALLEAGAKPDFAPPGTPPPLYRASEEAHAACVRLLLDQGASPDGADGKSWLPLQGAAASGVPEVVKMLLDAGARLKAKPAGGGTLQAWARGPYAREIVQLLETAGARKRPP